jgi:hypothetical protein
MAHYLLACADTRSLDDLDDTTLDDLIANPDTVPRHVWCESCTTWQPVADLVISAATGNAHTTDDHDDTEPLPSPRAGETDHADTEAAEDTAVPTPAGAGRARHPRRFIPADYRADRRAPR